jgi:hypothetical protein
MAKNRGKGTVLAVEISSVYTAIPQLISIDKSGEASETYSGRTIDGTKHSDMPNTGYISNPTIGGEMFFDSGNAVHTFLKTSMRTPPSVTPFGINFKLTDTAATPVVEIWNVTGIGVDEKYATDDGVKATITLQTSGDNS